VIDTEVGTGEEEAAPAQRVVPLALVVCLIVAFAALAAGVATWWAYREDQPGAVDIGFYDDMSTHHLQAVDMSRIYMRNGDDPVFLSFAREIEFEQIGDIRVMQDALGEWDETGSPDVAMEWMGMSVPQDRQPGMATPEEMEQLAAASGKELDELFTRLMIDHHNGGIHMAQNAAERAKLASTRRLATAMVKTQSREIDELNHARQDAGLPIYTPS
jgi:uncharacterized protein (DUF305 family)